MITFVLGNLLLLDHHHHHLHLVLTQLVEILVVAQKIEILVLQLQILEMVLHHLKHQVFLLALLDPPYLSDLPGQHSQLLEQLLTDNLFTTIQQIKKLNVKSYPLRTQLQIQPKLSSFQSAGELALVMNRLKNSKIVIDGAFDHEL